MRPISLSAALVATQARAKNHSGNGSSKEHEITTHTILDALKDIYDAERRLVKAIPARNSLIDLENQSDEQISNIEKGFKEITAKEITPANTGN